MDSFFRLQFCAFLLININKYTHRTVGMLTGYRLDDQEFSLPHVVLTGCGVHTDSYMMGTWGSFTRGIKLTTHSQLVLMSRKRGSIHPLPHTSPYHSA
jgi:hypothetical protein